MKHLQLNPRLINFSSEFLRIFLVAYKLEQLSHVKKLSFWKFVELAIWNYANVVQLFGIHVFTFKNNQINNLKSYTSSSFSPRLRFLFIFVYISFSSNRFLSVFIILLHSKEITTLCMSGPGVLTFGACLSFYCLIYSVIYTFPRRYYCPIAAQLSSYAPGVGIFYDTEWHIIPALGCVASAKHFYCRSVLSISCCFRPERSLPSHGTWTHYVGLFKNVTTEHEFAVTCRSDAQDWR